MSYTPGPWRRGKQGGSVVADVPVPEMGGSDAVEYYGGHLVAESITPSNAKLIAAAPDMLALLAELIDIEGPQPGHIEWANKVKAVIAKATA